MEAFLTLLDKVKDLPRNCQGASHTWPPAPLHHVLPVPVNFLYCEHHEGTDIACVGSQVHNT